MGYSYPSVCVVQDPAQPTWNNFVSETQKHLDSLKKINQKPGLHRLQETEPYLKLLGLDKLPAWSKPPQSKLTTNPHNNQSGGRQQHRSTQQQSKPTSDDSKSDPSIAADHLLFDGVFPVIVVPALSGQGHNAVGLLRSITNLSPSLESSTTSSKDDTKQHSNQIYARMPVLIYDLGLGYFEKRSLINECSTYNRFYDYADNNPSSTSTKDGSKSQDQPSKKSSTQKADGSSSLTYSSDSSSSSSTLPSDSASSAPAASSSSRRQHCTIESFKFHAFPRHVQTVKYGAYRSILIQRALNRTGAVLYVTPNHRFISQDIGPTLEFARSSGLAGWAQPDSTSRITHHKSFLFFHTREQNYYFHRTIRADRLLVYGTEFVLGQLMLPWVQCALTEPCIAPIGAQDTGCRRDRKPLFLYSGCHGYDQSILNLVLGLVFQYDAQKYSVREDVRPVYFYSLNPTGRSVFFLSPSRFKTQFVLQLTDLQVSDPPIVVPEFMVDSQTAYHLKFRKSQQQESETDHQNDSNTNLISKANSTSINKKTRKKKMSVVSSIFG